MKRLTSVFALFICALLACLSPYSVLAAPDISKPQPSSSSLWTPVLTLPNDTTYHLCTGDSVCYPISVTDYDDTDTLTLSLLQGPISYTPQKFPHNFSTTICWTPTQSGDFRFIWQVTDKGGRKDIDTVVYSIVFNRPPHIDDQFFSYQECYTITTRKLAVVASDPDGDALTYKLLTGSGSINSLTGLIQYLPPSEGVYRFTVEVSDKCSKDTANVTDTVRVNQKPYFSWTDTTLSLCTLQQICVELKGIDPEHGPMEIRYLEGPGTLDQRTDTTAKLCFTPADVAESTYTFIICVADLCPYAGMQDNSVWPNCFKDTINITVRLNQPPVLACPPGISFDGCRPGEKCFDISATDPNQDSLTYRILSNNATISGTKVCVTDSAVNLNVVIEVSDKCGRTDTCSIPVTAGNAHPPYATLPDDFSMSVCQAEQVCIDAFADDPDHDIATVVTNIGTYNPNTNKICFTADTSGIYQIILTATDQCGLQDADTVHVSIGVNQPPVVRFAADVDSAMCMSGELCFDVFVSDDNLASVWVSEGTYNAQTGKVCFTPQSSGTYKIIVRATDDCKKTAEDTLTVKVLINNPPVITGLPDTTIYLCNPQYVCLPLTITDADKNIKSITTNRGQISNGSVCFVPYSQGTYPIIVTATDSCGGVDVDTALCTVKTDQAIVLTCPRDTSIFLCAPDTLCFPVGGVPVDAKVNVIGTSAWWSAEKQSICFYSECCLENHIKFEVTSACGTVRTCEFTVKVKTNTAPQVLLPRDTAITQCASGQICVPVGVTDAEKNLVKVEATGGTYDAARGVVCINLNGSGSYSITVTATDACGAVGTDQMTINTSTNVPPVVGFGPVDTLYNQCAPAQICLPLIVSDANNNIKSIATTLGQYDPAKQQICFSPNGSGRYCAQVIVFDSCNTADTANLCVTVKGGTLVDIVCPGNAATFATCQADTFCTALPDIHGTYDSLKVSYGYVKAGQLCFPVDTTGKYVARIKAYGSCNIDSCDFAVNVTRQRPVDVSCPGSDTTLFLCQAPQTMSFPVALSGDADNLLVLPQGATYANGRISFQVSEPGQYTVGLVASNSCSRDSCSFKATIAINHPPVITGSPDTTIILCGDTGYVAFTYTVSDPDNNIKEITSTLGVIEDNLVIFKPTAEGKYNIVLAVLDACGLKSTDTVVVTVQKKPAVDIKCLDNPVVVFITVPDTVRVPLQITPANAPVTVLPNGYYDWAKGEVVVYAENLSVLHYTVIATGECNVDTCSFALDVRNYNPPMVECLGRVDTMLCLSQPDTLCLPVTVSGSNVTVTVSPYGYYKDGSVCLPVSAAGQYTMTIIASNGQQADTCVSTVVVRANRAPLAVLEKPKVIKACQLDAVCFDATFTDPDNNIASTSVNLGQPTMQNDKLRYCFSPDTAGTYRIIASVTDSCGLTDYDTTYITVNFNTPPRVNLGNDMTKRICAGETICLPVSIQDENLESVIVAGGTYDVQKSQVCFDAPSTGLYAIVATATDSCGASSTDTVKVNVTLNQAPTVTVGPDTTIYLCTPQNICLTLNVNDPDGNIKSVTTNRGQISGRTICFVPYGQGTYPIVVTVVDSCGLQAVDTAWCTVKTDQAITLVCPRDTSIFLCAPDTLCFPVGGVPSDATVKVTGTAAWWSNEKQSICFYSECCLENTIKFDVISACGTIRSCQFTVKVKTNTAPLVLLPRDTIVTQCASGQICLPVGVTDAEKNLLKIEATGGTYDAARGVVCFTPSGTGKFTITVKATDACGASGTDQIEVTVQQNSKPYIIYQPGDTVFSQCKFSEICLPVTITDLESNLKNVNVIGGTYNASTGKVCFLPTDTGRQCISIVATDECGLKDSIRICVRVTSGGSADIVCNAVPVVKICKPQQVCVPITITGFGYTVSTSFGSYSAGQLCFPADTSGTYVIRLIATAGCGADTCTVSVPVQILPPVDITCPGNQTISLCGPDTICFDYTTSASVTNVRVNSAGYLSSGKVCVPVLFAGAKVVRLIADGQCGSDTCTFTVTSTFNGAPMVTASDTSVTLCTLAEICVPITATDPNGNLKSVTSSRGQVKGNSICFTPSGFGVFDITITATDSCDLSTATTIHVSVLQGAAASIVCPEGDQFVSLCKPDSVYIIMPISPANATVTVLPNGHYNPATGKVAIWVSTGGTYSVTVIAAAACGADTCNFNLRVDLGQAPIVSCPGTKDTTLCLASPTTLCFPITVTGTGVQVSVAPSGSYSAGYVCIPATAPGSSWVKVTATGTCGVATCSTLVTIRANQTPGLTLPVVNPIERCPNDTTTICIDGISASDPESPVTVTKLCGPGELVQVGSGYKICFKPASIAPQKFCIQVSDGCHTVVDTLDVDIVAKADCDVCAKVEIVGGPCTPVGIRTSVDLRIKTNEAIGGFDLLMSFDPTALSFQLATIANSDITGWEYFTYNLNNGNCGSSCPPGMLRLVGIADVNNGTKHPPDSTYTPNGLLARIEFLVANNQNLGGQFVPINFVWYDCGDNSFSDRTGAVLYIDKRIYNAEKILLWDEDNDVLFPEASRTFGVGASDACLGIPGSKVSPVRCVDFVNGGVCIIHPDSIDDRGDINLNGISNEIADAVLFSRYFIYGLAVFTVNQAGQIAATDVNADGLTLTVSDLSRLIRIVVGDADPTPKLSPYPERLIVSTDKSDGAITLSTKSASTIGTAYFVCKLDPGVRVGAPRLLQAANGMELMYNVDGDLLKILVYDIGTDRIGGGDNGVVQIPVTGDGGLTIQNAELCDYNGRPYSTSAKVANLPQQFALAQNYPNPFNPSTTISFSLPSSSTWKVSIYNVAGSLVREFTGASEAGTVRVMWPGTSENGSVVASGIYFYRLQAGSYSETRKMMLLK